MSADAITLQLDQLAFAWPDRVVLQRCSTALKTGITWLRGPNGVGKSTLLQLLAGVLRPLQGTARLLRPGQPALDLQADHRLAWRHAVFWCGPGAVAYDHLSPLDFWSFLHGLYPDWQPLAVVRHAEAFGLGPHLDRPLARLSTGTQRKVWLVAALAAGTPVRLLDEPLNALDDEATAYLQDQLAQAQEERSALWLVASHDAPLPAHTAPVNEWRLAS